MTYTIRMATVADAHIITHHRRGMFEDMGYETTPENEHTYADFEAWVKPRLASGEFMGWFMVAEGEVIAGASLRLLTDVPPSVLPGFERSARIFNVYTEPQHRRQGYARVLMDVMIDWCKENGITRVTLAYSEKGRPLYESLGFTIPPEMVLNLAT